MVFDLDPEGAMPVLWLPVEGADMSDFLQAWDHAIMEARVLGEQRPVWCIQTTTKGEMGVFMAARTMHPSFMQPKDKR